MKNKKAVEIEIVVKNPKLADAWKCVKSICPRLNINFKYDEEYESIELNEAFVISFERNLYHVSVIKYLPGDRETPPDTDIIDLASFVKYTEALMFAIKKLKDEEIDMAFADYSEAMYDEEMSKIEEQMSDKKLAFCLMGVASEYKD